jgi:hypothetical protein
VTKITTRAYCQTGIFLFSLPRFRFARNLETTCITPTGRVLIGDPYLGRLARLL